MQRKEVLSKLEVFLNNLEKISCSNKLKAELVLIEIENLGMVPPLTSKLIKNFHNEYITSVYEWED